MDLIKLKKRPAYPFETIAVAVSFSPRCMPVLAEAKRLSDLLGASLVLIHIGVKTTDKEKFYRAVEKSKDETDVIPLGMGGCIFARLNIFPRIGMLDPQFDWACGDFDFYWRLRLNGMKSVTLKKITIAHGHGVSRMKDIARWNKESDEGKQKFYNKHGYVSYRILRSEYKGHNYFLNYEA